MASKNKSTIPTRAQGPNQIPPDVQQDILELGILLNRLTELSDAYDRKKDQIAARLIDGITVEVRA